MIQGLNLVFFGIVGSGKGTQAKLLRDYIGNTEYIYPGEMYRNIVESPENDMEIKKIAKDLISAGKLVPDEITNQLVADTLASIEDIDDKNLLFDGYPRTVPQSEHLLRLMENYGRKDVRLVFITLSEDEAMERNLLRGRHDDTEEGLKQRFQIYKEKVVPAMEYLKDRPGYSLHVIDGEQTVEEVHNQIIQELGV